MAYLETKHRSLTSSPIIQPARRLMVLIPYLEADLAPIAYRVWELANASGARVQFIGLYTDATLELSLRRQLINLSAMVNDGKMIAETEVIFGKNWVDVVKLRWQVGDLVVCFAEQRVGLLRKPLSQVLLSDLDVPLFILSDLYPQNDSDSTWTTQIAAWVGSIAVIFSFFLLQVRIDHLAEGLPYIVLEILSITVEVWMIWAWNSLFR